MRRLLVALVITISFASASHAEVKFFEDWMAYTDDAVRLFASTMNDSKNTLAQVCEISEASCYWSLVIAARCEKDERYPAIVSADAGAVAIELVCQDKTAEGRHRYILANFDDINKVVRASQRIAIVFPWDKGDEFKVVRFSLKGAVKAIDLVREQARKKLDAQPANTKDRKI